jgi:tetratricopeptide (TPR) repeat protein
MDARSLKKSLVAGIACVLWLTITACRTGSRDAGAEGESGELRSTTRDGRLSPWLSNLGNLHRAVTTNSEDAQRFFDQALTLYYGFNHAEAERSFKEVARLDPNCAMAYWGQAISLGPNINDPWPDPDREKNAHAAIQKALETKSGASEVEQALIDALATRYAASEKVEREALNKAYAKSMAKVYGKYPEDPDAGALYAEAIMDTMPWDYWTKDGMPRAGMENALAALEKVIQEFPEHPGAHHFYIHAVEASKDPDRGAPSADKLGGLAPGAGHLVHMPSHIYIRVGRYQDAVTANERAILADEDYITQCRAQGIYPAAYYPHNIHMLWAALTMEGRRDEAMEAARKVAAKMDDHMLHTEGFAFGHLLRTIPMVSMARFGQWDDALREPQPSDEYPFIKGMWHYVRGLAHLGKDNPDAAEPELKALRAIAANPELGKMKIFDQNALSNLLEIATSILAGELASKRGDFKAAVAHLRQGIQLEDNLIYSEPPDWYLPVRHSLGAVLLEAGRAPEAERVYREDLARHRNNGWSLYGLTKALEAQGKSSEAAEVRAQFQKAWSRANVKLTASRL